MLELSSKYKAAEKSGLVESSENIKYELIYDCQSEVELVQRVKSKEKV